MVDERTKFSFTTEELKLITHLLEEDIFNNPCDNKICEALLKKIDRKMYGKW